MSHIEVVFFLQLITPAHFLLFFVSLFAPFCKEESFVLTKWLRRIQTIFQFHFLGFNRIKEHNLTLQVVSIIKRFRLCTGTKICNFSIFGRQRHKQQLNENV